MKQLMIGLRLRSTPSHWLGRVAILLTASGVAHLLVGLIRGGDFSGAVSFRKPVTFAFSFALLLWACGVVIDQLPRRKTLGRLLAVLLAVSSLAEVGLITIQAWRGVPSHFNVALPFDAAVFGGMGISIAVSSLALGLLTLWALIEPPPDRAMRLAVWAGMLMVMAGLGIGLWVIELGFELLERLGAVPDTVLAGEAGVAKFPHALALHGLQVFVVFAVIGERFDSEKLRLSMVAEAVSGYALLLGWALVHTNAGRAPVDPTGAELLLAASGVLLLGRALFRVKKAPKPVREVPVGTLPR